MSEEYPLGSGMQVLGPQNMRVIRITTIILRQVLKFDGENVKSDTKKHFLFNMNFLIHPSYLPYDSRAIRAYSLTIIF